MFVSSCAYTKCLRRGTPKGSKVTGEKTSSKNVTETSQAFEMRVTSVSTKPAIPTTMCFECNVSLHNNIVDQEIINGAYVVPNCWWRYHNPGLIYQLRSIETYPHVQHPPDAEGEVIQYEFIE